MTAPLLPSLLGVTGAGKSGLAVLVGQRLDLEIVSADSRQVYRRFDVGTAKPTPAERAAAPHHLVDVADPRETYTAARFAREAHAEFEAIRARGRTPFLVGGSGLYLRAAEEGLFEGPDADPELRERLAAEARGRGVPALHARLAEVDPESAARLHPNDRVRVMRALEVWELTGVTLSEHHRRHREATVPVRCLRFGLAWPTRLLERRLERRVDEMLAAGWEAEVRELLDDGLGDAPAMNALGYPEVRALVEGKIDAAEARARIVRATRQFAKRQRTWFRAVKDVEWLDVRSEEDLAAAAERMTEAIAAARAAAGT